MQWVIKNVLFADDLKYIILCSKMLRYEVT